MLIWQQCCITLLFLHSSIPTPLSSMNFSLSLYWIICTGGGGAGTYYCTGVGGRRGYRVLTCITVQVEGGGDKVLITVQVEGGGDKVLITVQVGVLMTA